MPNVYITDKRNEPYKMEIGAAHAAQMEENVIVDESESQKAESAGLCESAKKFMGTF